MAAATPESFPLMGARATVLADAERTSGTWEAIQIDLGEDGRSPLHTLASDKLFHVLDGAITFTVGETTETVTGGPVWVPANTPHRYLNESGAPARMVVITSGGEQADFLRGMSRLAAGGPPDAEAVAEHARAHGVELLPAAS